MVLWTEDELYELAKRVHPPRRPSPPALKAICVDFTINKWKTWTDLGDSLGINPFDKIRKHTPHFYIGNQVTYSQIYIFSIPVEKRPDRPSHSNVFLSLESEGVFDSSAQHSDQISRPGQMQDGVNRRVSSRVCSIFKPSGFEGTQPFAFVVQWWTIL